VTTVARPWLSTARVSHAVGTTPVSSCVRCYRRSLATEAVGGGHREAEVSARGAVLATSLGGALFGFGLAIGALPNALGWAVVVLSVLLIFLVLR
jgi:hypothetical protein